MKTLLFKIIFKRVNNEVQLY